MFTKGTNGNVLYIRHGETNYNTVLKNNPYESMKWDTVYTDLHLNQTGFSQAAELKSELSAFKLKYVFCSPLNRCVDTCIKALEDHPQRESIEIVIHPLITETVGCIADVNQPISQKMEFYEMNSNGLIINWDLIKNVRKLNYIKPKIKLNHKKSINSANIDILDKDDEEEIT